MSVPRHRSPGSKPRRGARPAAVLAAAAGAGAAALLVERLRFSRLIRAEVHPDLRVPCLVVPPAIALGRQLIRAALTAHRPPVLPALPARRAWGPALDLQELTAVGPGDARAVRVVVAADPGTRAAISAGERAPALLWVHGGGHVLGDADAEVYRRLARDLGAVAVSVEYRTAFTAPHPADVDDCWTALDWLLGGGLSGVDPQRVAVVGESAGGGTAASLVQRVVDSGVRPAAQVLIYPMLDDRAARRLRGAQAPRTRGRILWSRGLDRLGWAAYLHGRGGAGPRSARPYSVPGRRPDLSGMPPTWIGVGNLDLFRDDAVAYAGRLRRAGAECELVVVPSMYHAADRVAPRARACATSAARWSRTCAATWRRARQCLRRERQGARARPPVPASSKLPF